MNIILFAQHQFYFWCCSNIDSINAHTKRLKKPTRVTEIEQIHYYL